jgi:hypothetical protein
MKIDIDNFRYCIDEFVRDEKFLKIFENPLVVIAVLALILSYIATRTNYRNRQEEIRKLEKSLSAQLNLLSCWWQIHSTRFQAFLMKYCSREVSVVDINLKHLDEFLQIMERYHVEISSGFRYLNEERIENLQIVQYQIRKMMSMINAFRYNFERSDQSEIYVFERNIRGLAIEIVITSLFIRCGISIANRNSLNHDPRKLTWDDIINHAQIELNSNLYDLAKLEMDVAKSSRRKIH